MVLLRQFQRSFSKVSQTDVLYSTHKAVDNQAIGVCYMCMQPDLHNLYFCPSFGIRIRIVTGDTFK